MTDDDWLQIEQASRGCISGTSDEWPALREAIEKLTGRPFGPRKTSDWLQGFCEAAIFHKDAADSGMQAVCNVETLFSGQAATLSKSGSVVRISCDNAGDANEAFHWLEAIGGHKENTKEPTLEDIGQDIQVRDSELDAWHNRTFVHVVNLPQAQFLCVGGCEVRPWKFARRIPKPSNQTNGVRK